MEHALRILDSSGDTVVKYNDADAAAKAEAQALFDRLTTKGHRFINVNRADGKENEIVHRFSEIENEAIAIVPVVGG